MLDIRSYSAQHPANACSVRSLLNGACHISCMHVSILASMHRTGKHLQGDGRAHVADMYLSTCSMRSSMWLRLKTHEVVCACTFIATCIFGLRLPQLNGREWWEHRPDFPPPAIIQGIHEALLQLLFAFVSKRVISPAFEQVIQLDLPKAML